MRLAAKLPIGAVALAGATLGTWYYASPSVTVNGLRSAVLSRDSTALNGYVDFDALRTNLKAQFVARLVSNNLGAPGSKPEFAATRLKSIEALVDGMISPQALDLAMERVAQQSTGEGDQRSLALQPIRRDSFNQFHLPIDPADTIAVRFERRGLSWRVTDLKLPYDLNSAFARRPELSSIENPE